MADHCSACGAAFREGDAFCSGCGAPRDERPNQPTQGTGAQPAPSKSRGQRPAVIVLAAILVGIVPMALFFGLSDCGGAEGSMQVRGGPYGDFTFVPTGCASMQPYGRMGANVHAKGHNDGAVYVSGDPIAGAAVDIEVPGSCRDADGTDCTIFHVPRERCDIWEARVVPTGTIVNEVRLVKGHVRLSCALEDGTAVNGSITFDGC